MCSYSTRNRQFQKKQQKNSKNQKTPTKLLFKPKQVGKGREREKIKKIVLIGLYPTRNRKFQKNSTKNSKNQKTPSQHLFEPNQVRKSSEREEKKKKNSFDVFLPDWELKIPKKLQKNSKNYKTPSQLLFKTKQVGKGHEREKIEKKSFQCVPTRPVIENSKKNCKKIQEFTKHHHSFISSQNRLGKAQKGRK